MELSDFEPGFNCYLDSLYKCTTATSSHFKNLSPRDLLKKKKVCTYYGKLFKAKNFIWGIFYLSVRESQIHKFHNITLDLFLLQAGTITAKRGEQNIGAVYGNGILSMERGVVITS